ncbi:MAG: DUF87 domain-containing protein [Anaerolineae bacterium]|nr:DUF87 domain-containing protein [Anaerolineae bacterium]
MQIHFSDKPNQFYLGAKTDPETHEIIPDEPVYYDANDLTTHGIILGMTGSGKSGLAITLLEEAALSGIPQIIIDPKGDITNMLLAFPEFSVEHFKPWVNPQDAGEAGIEAFARQEVEKWKAGIERWGMTPQRIQEYRRSARFSIYTPGSEAGLPISIVASFAAPSEGWPGNEEILRERITGIVTAILALIGKESDPVEDPEHILLANIFEYHWRQEMDVSVEQLILNVQDPPFTKLGVMDIDTVIAEKDRMELAKQLNQMIAAPGFQSWLVGEPVDIPSLLYTENGDSRVTIFYVAHLNDAERQFIITLLLENILAWMHSLSGSAGLRALLYIDEMFGMFPPYPYNPPTKDPIMRLLKQARALGVGVLMATQNAKDLDYKGLTNAGTWFVGKLQTDHDRQRVSEGLDVVDRTSASSLDVSRIEDLIGQLNLREFVVHNVHNPETPYLMHTRHAMSYLRGPLTRPQIETLMANQRDLDKPARPAHRSVRYLEGPSSEMRGRTGRRLARGKSETNGPVYGGQQIETSVPSVPLTLDEAPPGFLPVRPALSKDVKEYFLPVDFTADQTLKDWRRRIDPALMEGRRKSRLLYRPSLLAQLSVQYTHRPTHSVEKVWYAFIIPDLSMLEQPTLEWGDYQAEPFDLNALELRPHRRAYYGDLPRSLTTHSGFAEIRRNLLDWVYEHFRLTVYHNPALDIYNALDESRAAFVERMKNEARRRREAELDKLVRRYDRKFDRLEDRATGKISRIDSEENELEARKQEQLLSSGESVLRLLKGSLFETVSRIARLRRYSTQTDERIEVLEEDLQQIMDNIDETEAEMDQEIEAIQNKWAAAVRQIEEVPVTPNKNDIVPHLFGIGWVPHWHIKSSHRAVILPASRSGLASRQMQLNSQVRVLA